MLAAERRLERETDGRGWARDVVERLCVDRAGNLLETCERDGERELYLSPRDRERFAEYEDALTSELTGYLLEHARRERLVLMSRPVVESTLFRARRRLSEEYEELASGRRCARVQSLIESD